MIVSMSSVGGAPGVSSWSLLLAAAWPPERAVDRIVVEADVDGGVAAARYGVGASPGVAQLLSAVRGGGDAPDDLSPFARHLGNRGWLVPGTESSESASAIWSAPGSATNAATALQADARLWVLDVGRAGPAAPLAPVLRASAAVVVLSRGDHASLVQLPSRIRALRDDGCAPTIIGVSGPTSFPVGEIREFCDAPVIDLPHDPHLPITAGAVWTSRRARRRAVWRQAVATAASLDRELTAGAPSTTPTPEASRAR